MRRLSMVLVLALCGLLALAAPVAAADKEPVKIGAFFAESGPAAFIGTPTKLVALMVVDQINAKGGIQGRPIELVLADTEGKPTKAVMAFKKFVNLDKVVAVIGPTRTGTGMAVKKQVEAAKIPTVMTVGGDPVIMEGKHGKMDFGTAKYVFKAPQRSSIAVKKVLGYLKKHNLTKVALISASDGFGRDGARWIKRLAPKYGLTIVGAEQFNPKDVDMKSQLTKLASKNPQAIICWTIGPAGAIISKNHNALGLKAPLVQCHGLPGPRYIALAGAAAEGDLMPATKLMIYEQLPDSDPQKKVIAEFVELYKQRGYAKKYPINTHSGYAWDAVYLLANAMQKAGTDPDKVRAALENTKGYVGVSGVYNMSPKDHNGLGEDSMVMLEVKDGKFVIAQ
ncbi:MAG: ABC transporter substrate-binding protein [Desulfarculaceae bacterium]|nr:ABC transporter substrate-binding protein [Desulfarculaceae bacterium]MCF8071297.1 ABC transporter substrate-binding protein [Desulfarculaceae bacterium]MCF8101622.1 ABC transporter substrate-binding protein [Desulfarculaceae bacterium]MCF8117438.1 ABC transporter substrate-binding protein [Desulfarculaceae bacterium]